MRKSEKTAKHMGKRPLKKMMTATITKMETSVELAKENHYGKHNRPRKRIVS